MGPTRGDGTSFDDRVEITELCTHAIMFADLVFVWLDSSDAYGTLAEIGFAYAKNKEILIGGPNLIPDLWFAYTMSTFGAHFKFDKPADLLRNFLGISETQHTPPNFPKAIETEYKGYRFRSRLEARWAVFFDTLGVKWEYEKEGYSLDGGTVRYLPDFWLPQVSLWAEVKGQEFTPKEQEKCRLLALETGCPCLMLPGMPDFRAYDAYSVHPETNDDTILMDYQIGTQYLDEGRFYGFVGEPLKREQFDDGYHTAIRAARQARFEHGETPKIARLK